MDKKFLWNKLLFLFCFIFLGCNSLKQPDSVVSPLNYTDEDVVQAEIERIEALKQEDSVKALWRACLLGNDDVINSCYKLVESNLTACLENKDYSNANKYYISLKTVNPEIANSEIEKQLKELYLSKAFILEGVEEKAPSSISDCIKATCTIWVDKGIKFENGAGFSDIVIGSGFFIDKRGYIITNYHVIQDMVDSKYEGYSRLYVKMHPETDNKNPAKVIGYDSILDLALLKVEIEPQFVLSLGTSSELEIGDKVSAIGTPIGLEGTLTSGIISSTSRKLLTLGNVFQIDAAVNSGNSGGPLIDEKMQVQAVVFAGMLQSQGLNFAIPVEYLKQELQLLYEGGEVNHSWISSFGRTVRKGNEELGLEVQYVIPGGIGCMAHLAEGDIITKVAGQDVKSLDDFQFILMQYEPGVLVPVVYLDGEQNEKSCFVYLEKRSTQPNVLSFESDFVNGSFIPMFGMKLKSSSTINRNSYIIEKVIRGGMADESSFSENDAITVREVQLDTKNEYLIAQIVAKQRTKGYLDIPIVLTCSFDSPYYF